MPVSKFEFVDKEISASDGSPVGEFKGTGYTDIGDPVLIPGFAKVITLTLVPTSPGVAKIQSTTSTIDDIVSNSAYWIDWDNGYVTGITQAYCVPPSALRVIVGSGAWAVYMRAQ